MRERNPFIAGSWVRGDNFFGRTAILREIMEGERDGLWVVGARRLGKTSLLKELEYRVLHNAQTDFVPLFWDLQGSGDVRGLADSLLGSVEDSDSFRRATTVGLEDLEGLAVFDMLTTLLRRTVRSGWRLLLLVDEAEEFLTVARAASSMSCRSTGSRVWKSTEKKLETISSAATWSRVAPRSRLSNRRLAMSWSRKG